MNPRTALPPFICRPCFLPALRGSLGRGFGQPSGAGILACGRHLCRPRRPLPAALFYPPFCSPTPEQLSGLSPRAEANASQSA